MKKQTQQTPLDPCPKRSAFVPAFIMVSAMVLAIGTPFLINKAVQHHRKKPVTCHECEHIAARSSASQKKKFKELVGQDDKYTILYFCKEHPQAWDYVIEDGFYDSYFKSRSDRQVTKAGADMPTHSTNVINYGIYFYTDTNGVSRADLGKSVTNIICLESAGAKHINH